MSRSKERTLTKASLAASIAAAVGASICCIGPIAAAFFGLTSFAALVKYEPLRPLFTVATLLFLAGAFYLAYRRQPAEACEPGSLCATHGPTRVQKVNRIVLWVVTAIVLIVLTFPTWSNWLLA
ncbi:MAG TPA: mercuric transporter MerT family protein [Thermoanaerobaculia bacterium]|nr:mercuric transporter MerT family protein [Thermoanaerobaculia bacterium]